jgi:hypothetical protein
MSDPGSEFHRVMSYLGTGFVQVAWEAEEDIRRADYHQPREYSLYLGTADRDLC